MTHVATTPKLIDIEKVFADKNPKLLKLIPKFVINYLKKVIHQERINYFVANNTDKQGLAYTHAALDYCHARVSQKGLEQIPTGKRYIFIANHPLGGLDGVAFIDVVGQRFPDVKFPVNDILMHLQGLRTIFVPINKHGAHGKDAARQLEEAFASDSQILFFPAGMVSRKIKGEITDLEWKKNFVKKAIAHRRDVVPVHISGHNSRFFYNLARFRKLIGLKVNIEMLYLPDEMFNAKTKDIAITFGTPVEWQKLEDERDADEWVKELRSRVYGLAGKMR
ncbi:MAG: 1-acyl-sn-glycerol-3-phosphate acyltransferase [Breznakibacter sp.]